jgi:hypothetical protein
MQELVPTWAQEIRWGKIFDEETLTDALAELVDDGYKPDDAVALLLREVAENATEEVATQLAKLLNQIHTPGPAGTVLRLVGTPLILALEEWAVNAIRGLKPSPERRLKRIRKRADRAAGYAPAEAAAIRFFAEVHQGDMVALGHLAVLSSFSRNEKKAARNA